MSYKNEQTPLQEQLKKMTVEEKKEFLKLLIQEKLNRPNINKKRAVTSILLLFFSGILPFFDNILILIFNFFNISFNKIEVPYFHDLPTFVWMLCFCLSPVLVVISTYLKPPKILFIFPLFSYLTMFMGTVLNGCGIYISGFAQFYFFIFLLSISSFYLLKRIKKYLNVLYTADLLKIDIVENILKSLKNKKDEV